MAFENLLNRLKMKELSEIPENNQWYLENRRYTQEMMKIGTWTYEIGNEVVYYTDEYFNIFETTAEKFNGNAESYYQLINPVDIDKVKESREKALSGFNQELEYGIITEHGKKKFVREKMKILLNETGTPSKIFGVLQDITEEKTVENSLKELGENLNLGQKVAGIGSWKYNSVKNEIFWSDEIYRIYDLKPEEFKGTVIELIDLTHPDDRYILKELTQRRLNNERFDLQYRIQHKNGTIKYIHLIGEPIKNEDHLNIDLVGTIQDMTEIKELENEIIFIKKNLERAQRLAKIGSWEMNVLTNQNFMSDEARRIFGVAADEFKGTFEDFMSMVHPDDKYIIDESFKNEFLEEPFNIEFRVIRKDGSIRDVTQIIEFNHDKNGKLYRVYGTIQDITEKKEYEKSIQLKQNEIERIQQRTKMLIQESGVVFEIITADGFIKYISDTSKKVINYDAEGMVGKSFYDYYQPDEIPYLKELVQQAIENKESTPTGIITFKGKTDKPIYLEVHIQNFLNHPIIQGLILDFRNVTNLIIMQNKIEKLASYDETTALPKQNQFKKELAQKCIKASINNTSLIVMMLDFEGYKDINDSLGYMVGQQLIIQIVMRLKGLLGKNTLISRYSEDKFAIVIEHLLNLEAYEERVQEVIDFFHRLFKIDIFEFDVNINIGISVYPLEIEEKSDEGIQDLDNETLIIGEDRNSDEIEKLIQYANIALVWSKKEGKNRYKFYSSELNIQNYKQFQLRHDLRMAIKKEQFLVYYQPMVRIKNNNILAVEALIRWNHPDWGIVSPEEFIFLAEETGAIVEMGKWVLRKVCSDHRYWIQKGFGPIYISVNFSGIQFYERDFVENIKEILAEYEVDPQYLIVELTEGLLIENAYKAAEDIQKLQSAGIKVALDDFGTGYSSLSYLKNFNIDIIKMDASFLKNILTDKTTTIIAKAIINLTKELHIKLVSEGLENWEQLSFLRENNCFSGQGYLYSRPVPLEKINGILEKGKCRPVLNNTTFKPRVERRKFFRQAFHELLKTDLTILKIKNKKMNVGNSKVLVKNIGPGGLCFISNIQFPLEREFTLQFVTTLLGKEINVYGTPVWGEEVEDNLFEYGVKFLMEESESEEMMRLLYEVQIKMKHNILFADGSFTDETAYNYFKNLTGQQTPIKVDFSQYKRNRF